MVRNTRATVERLLACAVCGLVGSCALADDTNVETPAARVVVQDARVGYLEISADAQIIVGRGEEYKSWHTFYVIDVKKRKTLLRVNLPQHILDAAIAPQSGWFAVAGERSIFRVDMFTGGYEVLLDGVTGRLELNEAGDRLAVLGQIDSDSKGFHRIRDASNLGIYDLQKEKWLAKCKTPIVARHELWFEGRSARAYGLGRQCLQPSSVWRVSLRCVVELARQGADRKRRTRNLASRP